MQKADSRTASQSGGTDTRCVSGNFGPGPVFPICQTPIQSPSFSMEIDLTIYPLFFHNVVMIKYAHTDICKSQSEVQICHLKYVITDKQGLKITELINLQSCSAWSLKQAE